jgi:antirestriction protein ArdC
MRPGFTALKPGHLERGPFCGQSHAAEELVTELSSAFLCTELGIKGELRYAGHIGGWLALLHRPQGRLRGLEPEGAGCKVTVRTKQ